MGRSDRTWAGVGALALGASLLVPSVALAQDASPAASAAAGGGECNVGVSWNNYEQPRWASTDQPNLKATIEAGGGTYQDFDAKLDSAQQLTDVETLINGGADVLILLAQDQDAAVSALELAKNAGIPVIAYDRLIEDPDVLYLTLDNVAVGEAEAKAIFDKVPSGTFVRIKGDPGDANASTFLPQGMDNAGLQDKIDSGDITLYADEFTDGWKTQTAQNNMEAIIDKANADGVTIDAILAENDSTALGVVAALQAKGLDPIPLSGQDGDVSNLQNVAAGWQYVDVWKNTNELGKAGGAFALQLCAGVPMDQLTLPDGLIADYVVPDTGLSVQDFVTPGGNTVKSFILKVTPVTQDNLNLPLEAGWKDLDVATLCANVTNPDIAAPICADAGAAASPAASAAG
jgi:D-xylose transport system substrate-binding protein